MRQLSSRKKLGALIGTVVLVGAGGWFAGTQVQSPADAAAAHSAPPAGPVTVAVKRQSLTATVVGSGSVDFASPEPLSLAGAVGTGTSGSGAAGGDGGGEQRVTKAPVAGAKVKEGDVLMTVNGRPVLALQGKVPMYRTLGPGTSGDDVKQLQQALRRLGFDPGAISGNFKHGTATAVTHLYQHKGYAAQQPSPDEQQQLGQLQQAVSSAQEALLTTTAGGSGSDGGHSGSPSGDGSSGTADAGSHGGTGSPDPQSSTAAALHRIQVKSAQKSLNMANAALSTFEASYGTKVPAGEVVFFPKLPVRLDKVSVKTGDTPSGQIGTVTSSDLVVQAVVPGSDAELLRKGMAVDLTTTDGEKAHGTIAALGADATTTTASTSPTHGGAGGGDTSGGATSQDTGSAAGGGDGAAAADPAAGGGGSAPVQLRISVTDPGPLAGQAGAAVKVTIKIGASDGKVLTVPLAAIHTSSDGKPRIQVQHGSTVSDVDVTVGLSAAGLVEVKPVGGTLKQGDMVVVGK